MKKVLSILICATLLLSTLLLFGCGDKGNTPAETSAPAAEEATLKLGFGVSTTVIASNATADKNGNGQATMTAAAVLVDNDGKIVKAVIDCADSEVAYTAEGKAVANDSFKTKYELGNDYNMKKYGNAVKEWFEQADAFCALIVGKTATEVKALVAEGNKGTQDVINAGCTIVIDEFVKAVDKAIANAVASNATAKDTLKLGASTSQSTSDATADKAGTNQVETTFFAAAVNAEGKVVAATSDCVQVKFTFDTAGASTFDATKAVSSKKELGDNYNMKKYSNAISEWYVQAAAFDAACIGKTVTEIKALMGEDNYAVGDLKASCTIVVDGFVKAAAKIG